jgi:8-oxo-dGTP pyrophosphatase MutT (NUDIX family)
MKLFEIAATPLKAGLLPYVMEGGERLYMFMVPSDPAYGGSKPCIAKGGIDGGETSRFAAIREAEEELGLIQSNIKSATLVKAWEGRLIGNTEDYTLTIYACEVKDQKDFNKPHYETGSVHWLSADEYASVGRQSQKHIVTEVEKFLSK